MSASLYPIVVLISGNGSNLQAIIDIIKNESLPAEIKTVISNRPNAFGLQRASDAGINTDTIDHTQYADRASFDIELQQCIDQYKPKLVVLAGFMRILTAEFVNHYHGRLINIHPSLLPDFPGLDTHQRAIDAKKTTHGASIHFVTDELDGGPVISQIKVPVLTQDNADTVMERVREQEHILYPQTVKWFIEGRIETKDKQVIFDGKPLENPLQCKPTSMQNL